MHTHPSRNKLGTTAPPQEKETVLEVPWAFATTTVPLAVTPVTVTDASRQNAAKAKVWVVCNTPFSS